MDMEMKECSLCEKQIFEDDETVKKRQAGDSLEEIHLKCFLEEVFFPVGGVVYHVAEGDGISVNPDGICGWCRKSRPTVRMARSGQEVCLPCLLSVLPLLFEWYGKNMQKLPYLLMPRE